MTSDLLSVSLKRTDRHTIVHVSGEVDMGTVPLLQDGLKAAITEGTPDVVVVDLTGVGFLSSAGLAALTLARPLVEEANANLVVVVTPGSPPERAITITNIHHVLRVVTDLDEATTGTA